MGKGILILLLVFGIIAIINIISIRLIKINGEKKSQYRKIFWYLYGTIFLLAGFVQMYEKGQFLVIPLIQSMVGLTFLVLNYLGKIVNEKNISSDLKQ